jgi:2-amino-4-hydroxy-6-hydroxymethyldihydropteridine diphosphokinase
MEPARQAFIGVGANLGDRWPTIRWALAKLGETPGLADVVPSPVFETDPVGFLNQPLFLNLVVGVRTALEPEELLQQLLAIETAAGRKRRARWGPRTLDLDLLLFEGETRRGPDLELPHPRMWERAFVLVPLRELLRAPRFDGPAWTELRTRLGSSTLTGGVRPWLPP